MHVPQVVDCEEQVAQGEVHGRQLDPLVYVPAGQLETHSAPSRR